MEKNQIKELIQGKSGIDFCRDHLFSVSAWIFEASSSLGTAGTYHEFRKTISSLIDISPNNVAIVGSGKYGFSLSPTKNLANFNKESDVDLVIISPKFFLEVWTGYRSAYYAGYSKLKRMHSADVFRNFVVIDPREPTINSVYLREIDIKTDEMKKAAGLKHRLNVPIKFRIYNTWEDAENYHAHSIEQLKGSV